MIMKYILLFITFFSFIISYSQSFMISGHISKGDNKTIYLLNSDKIEIDSTTIINSTYSFKGKILEPNIYYLKVKDFPGLSSILLDNSNIEVISNAEEMWYSIISGSKIVDEDNRLYLSLEKIYDLQGASFDNVMEAMEKKDSINIKKYESLNVQYTKSIND